MDHLKRGSTVPQAKTGQNGLPGPEKNPGKYQSLIARKGLERALKEQLEAENLFWALVDGFVQRAMATRVPLPLYAEVVVEAMGFARVTFTHPWVNGDTLYLVDTTLWKHSSWTTYDENILRMFSGVKSFQELMASGQFTALVDGIGLMQPQKRRDWLYPTQQVAA